MWHQVDHLVIWVVPALGLVAILGNSMFTCFGCSASEVHLLFLDVTSSGGAVTCTGHVTFCYKRLADASFEALFSSFRLFLACLALGSSFRFALVTHVWLVSNACRLRYV